MELRAYDIKTFCLMYSLKPSYLNQLIKANMAPRMIKLGRRVIILAKDALEWEEQLLSKDEIVAKELNKSQD